jgi:2-polyprenyl-3-methyl-5-hydroxy-6-metoxy-1,4-benzoquinol methylase
MSQMSRAEIIERIRPIILDSESSFTEWRATLDPHDAELMIRPDVKRVSLIAILLGRFLEPLSGGMAAEIGCGYGYLLFPLATLFQQISWCGVDDPAREYMSRREYIDAFARHHCEMRLTKITDERLPFDSASLDLVTFSEVMEHLPMERMQFVLSELSRVLRPNGLLVASSPNQASLANRIHLLRGRSPFEIPETLTYTGGQFGHIRTYTVKEAVAMMRKFDLKPEMIRYESNTTEHRGHGIKKDLYRCYVAIERWLPRSFGDTWYIVFRKA